MNPDWADLQAVGYLTLSSICRPLAVAKGWPNADPDQDYSRSNSCDNITAAEGSDIVRDSLPLMMMPDKSTQS